MNDQAPPVKTILLLEDEPGIINVIERLFKPYGDSVALKSAETVKDALNLLYLNGKICTVDALILDIMLPYGDKITREILKGEGDQSDIETGIHLLEHIRGKERSCDTPLWVSIITGRNAPDVLKRVEKLLNKRGRLLVKPFNDFVLENDIALVLGIKSLVDEILLPEGYSPPEYLE